MQSLPFRRDPAAGKHNRENTDLGLIAPSRRPAGGYPAQAGTATDASRAQGPWRSSQFRSEASVQSR